MSKELFAKYRLQLVREVEAHYGVDKRVQSPEAAVELLTNVLKVQDECEEVVILLTMDTKNNINGMFEVSRGTLSVSLVHPREVFKRALLCNAASIILAHNHPSGDVTPSFEDNALTERLKGCGDLMGIAFIDHIIVADDKHYSYKAEGNL